MQPVWSLNIESSLNIFLCATKTLSCAVIFCIFHWNGLKEVGCQMVWYLNTRQIDAILFSYVLVHRTYDKYQTIWNLNFIKLVLNKLGFQMVRIQIPTVLKCHCGLIDNFFFSKFNSGSWINILMRHPVSRSALTLLLVKLMAYFDK